MSLKKKINLCREFGSKVMLSDLCATNIRIPRLTSRWKDKVILDWLREHYGQVISKYKQITPRNDDTSASTNDLPVWSMWLQGEENAPEIVRLCLSRIRKHCGSHPFRLITKDNYHEYITLPEHILGKLKSEAMTFAHFSDIVRMYLLCNYGGLWLDATIFTASDIPEEIFASEYYTIKHKTNTNDRNVALQRWTTYLQGGRKDNVLCKFVLNMMLEYWRRQTTFIDYVMMDYFIALAYDELPECRRLIESVPRNNILVEDMRPRLGEVYDDEKYDELTRDTCFFKLTYKRKFPETVDGHETLYGHILNVENNNARYDFSRQAH